MNEIINSYIKSIGKEKRKDLLTIGFFVSLFFLFVVFAVIITATQNKIVNSRVAIDLNDGSVKQLTTIDAIKAREIEAYHHCRYFMENLFEFDKSNYNTRLNRALWVGDNSVKAVYSELMKNGWYNNVIDGNLRQYISYTDNDIQINFDSKPYLVVFKFKLFLRSDTYEEEEHSGVVQFYLADCDRDMKHNPHGFEVKELDVINFK